MKTVLALTLIVCSTTAHSAELVLGDAVKGKQLHSQDCVACHDSSVYTRPDRIKSLSGLEQRVLHVCDHEFLVLLFMIQAQYKHRCDLCEQVIRSGY